MKSLTYAQYVVLNHATDEAQLWELLWGMRSYGKRGEVIEETPPLALDDARSSLLDLIRASAVELYEDTVAGSRLVPPSNVGGVINDDANWVVPSESGRDTWYAVVITDSGFEAYNRGYELFVKDKQ